MNQPDRNVELHSSDSLLNARIHQTDVHESASVPKFNWGNAIWQQSKCNYCLQYCDFSLKLPGKKQTKKTKKTTHTVQQMFWVFQVPLLYLLPSVPPVRHVAVHCEGFAT